jgi:transcriptional regulator NrdR family protein
MNVSVTKRDGTKQSYNADKINMALEEASRGLDDQISKVVQVATEVSFTLFDGITTEQLDEALIQTALQNVKDDPYYSRQSTSKSWVIMKLPSNWLHCIDQVFRIMYEKVSNLIYWMRA